MMKELRNGTQFEECTLEKLLYLERLFDRIEYYVPNKVSDKYILIKDTELHHRSYYNDINMYK